jgi:hypothetical protein
MRPRRRNVGIPRHSREACGRAVNATIAAPKVDIDALAAHWNALVTPGEVREVRVPKTRRGGPLGLFSTQSGYFTERESFVRAVSRISGADAEAAYITLNPVKPELLARARNRLAGNAIATTGDDDIIKRTALLVDIDASRATGISSLNRS